MTAEEPYIEYFRQIESGQTIEKIHFSECCIDEIPEIIWKQPLEEIIFEDVAFENLVPPQIFKVKSLKKLSLVSISEHSTDWDTESYITVLPDEIVQLENLEVLDLTCNCLSTLPSGIQDLAKLKILELGENKFELFTTELPSLSKMKKLKFIGLSGLKELENLDMELTKLSALTSIKEISLQNIQIKELPTEWLTLKQLNRINMGYKGMPNDLKTEIRKQFEHITVWFRSS